MLVSYLEADSVRDNSHRIPTGALLDYFPHVKDIFEARRAFTALRFRTSDTLFSLLSKQRYMC